MSTLATKYRPRKFAEVVGQEEVVSIFKSIVGHPEESPRSIILFGPYGAGKSSLARLFVKALNCIDKSSVEVCGQCEICASDLAFSPYYQEFDSTQVGNVEFVRQYRSTLQFTAVPPQYHRVVIFDEIQAASNQAQAALLRILEDVPDRTFFVFCSTDIQKIIPTIRSRSVELTLNLVPVDKVFERLLCIAEAEAISIPRDTLYRIAMYSGGHVRDAVMRLDLFSRTDDKNFFIDAISSTERLILDFLLAVKVQNRHQCESCVAEFVKRPLAYLFRDWEFVVLNLLKTYTGVGNTGAMADMYGKVAEAYGVDLFKLLKYVASDWTERCFREDLLYQSFLWFLFYEFSRQQQNIVSSADRFRKT